MLGLGWRRLRRSPGCCAFSRIGSDLDDAQVVELAKILDEIKTERAQAAVDQRRALSAFAEPLWGDTLSDENEGQCRRQPLRLQSAERLREAVVSALGRPAPASS